MNKLEPKHIFFYLPYGLRIIDVKHLSVFDADSFITAQNQSYELFKGNLDQLLKDNLLKPILKRMTELTREELLTQGFRSHIDFLTHEHGDPMKAPYEMIEYCLSKNYDVFGLIEAGLAFDINLLEQ